MPAAPTSPPGTVRRNVYAAALPTRSSPTNALTQRSGSRSWRSASNSGWLISPLKASAVGCMNARISSGAGLRSVMSSVVMGISCHLAARRSRVAAAAMTHIGRTLVVDMSHATPDRVLAVPVVAMAATGLLSLRAGAADTAWVFTVHAVLGGSLLAATVLKLRRSVPMAARAGRWRRLALGLLVSLGVVAALTGGFLWVGSGELLTIGTWTVLTLHAWVGLLVVPLVVVHLLPRRWRVLQIPPRNGVSRRTVLAAGGLGLVGIGAFGLTSLADLLRGGVRRFTGSRWLPTGGIPPVTTFFGEGTPSIDLAAWHLTVA